VHSTTHEFDFGIIILRELRVGLNSCDSQLLIGILETDDELMCKILWNSCLIADGSRLMFFETFLGYPKIKATIPYWSIVLPLSAISAWLLLSKPRKKLTSKRCHNF
jgi:hypothetical protein